MSKKSFYICKIVKNTFGYTGTTPFLIENNNNTYEIRYNISKKIKELLIQVVPDSLSVLFLMKTCVLISIKRGCS